MKKLFVLLFACVSVLGYAQAPEVLPQVFSPNAAELGKYGKVPVSYFNGLPNISIPLTELKAKDYTLPIYLTYHAGGNKPDQHPGWVGQGWTLHAGGCINRIIRGMKDEMTQDQYILETNKLIDSNPGYLYVADGFQSDKWKNGFGSNEVKLDYDLEPDEFQINVEGINASFYLAGDGKVKIVSKSDDDFTVTFHMNDNAKRVAGIRVLNYRLITQFIKVFDTFNEFIVTSKDGTRYYFGGEEDAIEYSIVNRLIPGYYDVQDREQGLDLNATANTWMLTKIVRPNGEVVYFNYKREGIPIVECDSHRIRHEEWDDTPCPWNENTYVEEGNNRNKNISFYFLLPSYLESISCGISKDEVHFGTSHSTQLDYDYTPALFYERVGDSGLYEYLVPKYNHYEQLESIESSEGKVLLEYTNDTETRLKLDSIKIVAPQCDTLRYKMTYNNKTPLPRYYSRQTDFWGYYNYSRPFTLRAQRKQAQYIADSTLLKAEILTQIEYPTGGRTCFEYEPHEYTQVVKVEETPIRTTRQLGKAGGLRVKKITDYTHDGKIEERIITYTNGILSGEPQYNTEGDIDIDQVSKPRLGNDGLFHYCYFSENLLNQLSDTDGCHVTYSLVTETIPGSGKTEYLYSNHDIKDCLDQDSFDVNEGFTGEYKFAITSMSLSRGLLLRKSIFNTTGIVKNEQYFYEKDTSDCAYSIKQFYTWDPTRVYRIALTKLYTFYPKNTRKEVSTYPDDGGLPLVETIEYDYDDHRQLIKTTRQNGPSVEETRTLYSGDATLANNSPYSEMRAVGILNRPVEQAVLRDGKVISSSLTTYKPSSEYYQDVFVPDKYYEARLKEPCSLAKWEQYRYKGVFTDKQKEFYGDPKISFDSYSGYNNISLATEENGLSHRFIWDDDALFPEAHFTGELSTKSVRFIRETAKESVDFWGKRLKEYTFEFDAGWPDVFSFVMEWPNGVDYDMTGTLDGNIVFEHRAPGSGGGNIAMSINAGQISAPETELCRKRVTIGHHVFKVTCPAVKVGKLWLDQFLSGECRMSYPVIHVEESIKTPDVYYYDFEDDGGWSYAFNSDRGWPGEFVVTKQCPSGTSYRMDWMQQDCKGGVWKSHTAPYTGPTTIGTNAYAIDNIRIYPADAMATCWTWSRYGELRSIMNESGLTSSYDYDGLGRLVATRNTDGKLVSSYNYHYPTSDNPYAYVKTSQYRDEAGTTDKATHILGYVDGLGRPWQTIRQNAAGTGIHLAEQTDYDAAGRPFRTWLPFLTETLLPQTTTPSDTTLYSDSEPFSLVEYDGSPQDRPRLEYGPGKSWHSKGKAVRHGYYTNGSSAVLNCKRFTLTWSGDTTAVVSNNGNIPSATLSVKSITDEDGLTLLTFTNMYGQTLLERRLPQSGANLDTYYIYDGLGRLSVVLPPAIAEKQTVGQSDIDKYAYLYRYDARGNCIAKKLPGCGWTYYIYDKGSRLIFSQDAENRKLGRWVFSFSDIHGRNCLSGICEGERETLSNTASTANIVASRKKKNNALLLMDYYISNVQLSNPIVLSASYYDDYNHVSTNMLDPLDFCLQYGLQRKDDVHGLLTGTAERILGEDITNEFRWETYYYDEKGNILQTQTTREDGGVNITTTEWSFTGKPVRMNITHHYGESQESTEYYEYSYDDWDRPLTTKHRLGENAEWTTLSDISYDAIGRVAATECNGNPDLMTTHTYNVRSWKKSIAGPGMSENLTYEDYDRWNGNITSASYDYDGTTLHHNYTYDGLSRLVGATTVTEIGSSSEQYNYDTHSNVIAYERSGMDAISKSMSYNGNRMTSVASSIPGASGSISYDSIGRVISSDIEGMTEVKYNVVGYPAFVGQADGGYVHHTYTAGGARMASRRTDAAGMVTLMEYEGNEVIENGKLRMLLFDGGYVDFSGNAPRYCWYTKDHLGSVRAVADADGNVFATYAYSAYGEDFAVNAPVSGSSVSTTNGSCAGQVSNGGWTIGENIFLPTVTYSSNEGSDWQPFKFGGKESLTRVGLDLYDFGARMYSPSNMRWMTMDPLCEKHFDISPYAYCSGDPINRFDPDGMFDKKMFWSGVADILGGVALTTSGAAACAGTGGVGAALGGSAMLVEGISEICGGVTAVVEGCVLDAPEEGEQRFTPTGIIGTTAQGIDMAIGNDDFEVYHTVNAVMSLTGGIGLIKNLDKAIKIGRVSKSELIEMLSTSGQVTTTIAQKIEDNNNEANNDDQSSADTGQGSSGVNVGKDANPYIMWYNPSF